jgi:deazaflavin-dependent oxidoreductase (nitroreductase family)
VVVEVIGLERNVVRVASGFGHRAQWYRNIQSNGVAYISIGRFRRVKAHARLLSAEESAARLADYARQHPTAWRHLHAAMDVAQGGDADIPVIEFVPPRDPSTLDHD